MKETTERKRESEKRLTDMINELRADKKEIAKAYIRGYVTGMEEGKRGKTTREGKA